MLPIRYGNDGILVTCRLARSEQIEGADVAILELSAVDRGVT
jgi:hypothetical protein